MPYAPSGSNGNRSRRRNRRIGLYGGNEKETSCTVMFVQLSGCLNDNRNYEGK
jgi:hypothetical protein